MTDQQLINIAQASMLTFNKKDWDGVRSCTTADFVYEDVAANRKIEGVDQVIEAWQAWTVAFPDIHGTFVNSFVCGANVVCDESIVRGTHTGPMQTPDEVIPATGKSVNVRTCRIVEIEGERVKSIRHYFDMMTLMQQLGLAG
ncbi:MAG: ester cyclase [Candidatus Latescibacteria bacterium]|jgi:steroid delta-isomerase-like uncharacterized protein|nr:ester cyclase [Candidatus Latescibacterota bacterium]